MMDQRWRFSWSGVLPTLLMLMLSASACSASDSSAKQPDRPETKTVTKPPTPTTSTESSEATESSQLPGSLHVVVFFEGPRGREHIDVQLRSDDHVTTVAGVHADESRSNPPRQRFELSDVERREYQARVAALAEIPRCEPLAQLADEPTWSVDSERYNDRGPSLWFRAEGAELLASADPCLGYVRLTHFVYTAWVSHIGL